MSRLRELIAKLCPDGVKYKTLGSMGHFFGGLSGKTKADFGEGYPFVTYMNVFGNAKVNPEMVDYVRVGASERQNMLHMGDVLLTVSSETPDECGMSSVVTFEPDGPLYLNSFCTGWRPSDDQLSPDYMAYALRSWELRKQIGRTANGVIRFNVSKPLLAGVRIPVPPIEVQREIVRILDSFQELDDALTAEIEAREKQLQSSIDMMLGLKDVARIHGESVVLSSLCNSIFDGDHQPPPQANDGIPFIVIADFNKGEIDFSNTKYVGSDYYDELKAVRKPEKGDVILSVTGSYGISALVTSDQPFCFQRHVALLKPKCKSVFLLALLRSGYARRYFDMNVTGAIQKQISLTALRKMPVPVISEAQQEVISAKTRVMSDMVSAIRSEREARRKQFAYYRDKLLAFPELNKGIDK